MKTLLSFGGGVNSTALIVWLRKTEPETFRDMHIVFSDTGGELPETYTHLAAFEGWLKDNGQKMIRVGRPDTLEEYCLETKSTPMSKWRWCTDKWKIRPIQKWAEENLGETYTQLMGIASDEAHRAKPNQIKGITNRFPLVDQGITRQGCFKILSDAGIRGVAKSGCFYCPLMPSGQFVELKKAHPDLFARAVAMEKNSGNLLKHKPLEDIVGCKDKQIGLFGFENECDSGYCMT